jgi:aminoglycoside 2'-N-acetyltransferase I
MLLDIGGYSTKVNSLDRTFKITISHSDEISENEGREIEELEQSAFNDPEDEIDWANSEWYVTGKLVERIVSIVGILRRRIRVGKITLEVGGIGGVATHPDYRQCGFSSALLKRAAEFMRDDLQVVFGLLVCDQEMVSFYRKLGWQISHAELVFDLHGSKEVFQGITMVLPLGSSPWPEGVIDLCGAPW